MWEFWADVGPAFRGLWKARGFSTVVVATLGIALALLISSIGVVNAYLARSLPYPGSARLYNVVYAPPGQRPPAGLDQLDWSRLSDVIEHPIAWDLDMFYLVEGDHAEQTPGAWVTHDFMEGLGVRAELGRVFSPEEYRAGSSQVAMISYALWRTRFAGDPGIAGRVVRAYVSDRPEETELFTIIGVLPATFWHLNSYTSIFAPLRARTYPYMVRLRSGVVPEDAGRRITNLIREGNATLPGDYRVQIRSVHADYVAGVRPAIYTAGAAAVLVLLIACANVAMLMLIRAGRRYKEVAVRLALGASRGQIARLIVSEALILAGAATLLGLIMANLTLGSLAPYIQQQLGRPAPGGNAALSIDSHVVAAAAAAGFGLTGLLTLGPLIFSFRRDFLKVMKRGNCDGVESAGGRRWRSLLIALEVAGSVALLAASGLMIRTTLHMLNVDLGINAGRVITAPLALRDRTYPDEASRLAFYQRFMAAVQTTPGVISASLAGWPVHAEPPSRRVHAYAADAQGQADAGVIPVTPDHFATFDVALSQGRSFAETDRAGAEPVAIVSEALARTLWPTGNPLGQRIRVAEGAPLVVVGVAGNVRQSATDPHSRDVYVPFLQAPARFASVYLRVVASNASWTEVLRSEMSEIDPETSLGSFRSVEVLIAEQFARPRFLASMLGAFSLVAWLLALVGVYGVVAYGIRQREHEIAIRTAVGAAPSRITAMFLKESGIVIVSGVLIGFAGAIISGWSLASQLYGVSAMDPASLVSASALIAATGMFAVWLPSRRAARRDPVAVLRDDGA